MPADAPLSAQMSGHDALQRQDLARGSARCRRLDARYRTSDARNRTSCPIPPLLPARSFPAQQFKSALLRRRRLIGRRRLRHLKRSLAPTTQELEREQVLVGLEEPRDSLNVNTTAARGDDFASAHPAPDLSQARAEEEAELTLPQEVAFGDDGAAVNDKVEAHPATLNSGARAQPPFRLINLRSPPGGPE